MTATTAAGRYRQLEGDRQPFLDRAREASKYTIPTLLPEAGHNGSSKLYTPFQGMGARGVNNLASKLLLALLPPNSPFFRLTVDDYTLQEMTGQEGMRATVEKALSKIERAVMSEIEGSAMRVGAHEALKHLVVAGNVLLYLPKEGGMRVFRLDRFVVKRDPMGNVLELIVKEDVAPDALPEEIRTAIEAEQSIKGGKREDQSSDKSVELFTRVWRDGDKWRVQQEAKDKVIPSSKGTYPLDKSPWIALRWTRIDGEDYGRSHCDEYIGDLKSLEGLSKAIVEGAAVAARVIPLVDPNGTTDEDDLAEAENFDFVTGRADDVTFLQVAKFADFSVAQSTAQNIEQRLSFAFMLNTSIQRGGERVTAEEIRYMAGELEDALGGVYSILSQEMQLPLVSRLMHTMARAKKLPALPKGTVKPAITTGLEALGRGHDLNKLDMFIAGLRDALGPEVLARSMNVGDYIQRRGAALGIDTDGLIKSPEQQAQEQQQAMMMQMMDKLGPNAINQMGAGARQAMEQGNGGSQGQPEPSS
jgi:hypothetical protein